MRLQSRVVARITREQDPYNSARRRGARGRSCLDRETLHDAQHAASDAIVFPAGAKEAQVTPRRASHATAVMCGACKLCQRPWRARWWARAGGVNGRSALPPLGHGGLLASFAASSHYSSGRACAGAECGASRECYPLLKRMQRAIRAHATETCQCRRVPITAALYSAPHAPRFSERIIDLRRGTRCAAGRAGVMRETWRLVAGGRHLDVSAGRDY